MSPSMSMQSPLFQGMQGSPSQWPWLQNILQNINNGGAGVTLPRPMPVSGLPPTMPSAPAAPPAMNGAQNFGLPFWRQVFGANPMASFPVQPISPAMSSTGAMPGAALQAKRPVLPPPPPPAPAAGAPTLPGQGVVFGPGGQPMTQMQYTQTYGHLPGQFINEK